MFKTRVTEMLGIDYPIVAGGMHQLSTAEFAAAVSNAGGLGIVTSANFETADELRNEIRKAKSLTDKPLGININVFTRPITPVPNEQFVEIGIEEGIVAVETSGVRMPEEYIRPLKEAGVKLIHKVASVRHAINAERAGADMVALVGWENGGHVGLDEVSTMVLVPIAVSQLKVPVIAGGGIGDARGFVAALALGAEAVVIGTRFMATKECPAHFAFKEWMLRVRETDTVVVEKSRRVPHRALRNRAAEEVAKLESRNASLEELLQWTGSFASRLYILKLSFPKNPATSSQIVHRLNQWLFPY